MVAPVYDYQGAKVSEESNAPWLQRARHKGARVELEKNVELALQLFRPSLVALAWTSSGK